MENSKQKLAWLEYDLLKPYTHVAHGVFLRGGGTSEGAFAALNLGDGIGDHPQSVRENRERVRQALGVAKVCYAKQTHGSAVERVRLGRNDEKVSSADALYTTDKDIGLAVTHADCQAAIFYDPVHEAIGVAHAGWKGIGLNIYERLIETMGRELGTQPQNLLVCISPSLGPDHAEQKNYKQELPQDLWEFQTKPFYFDFWQASKKQLASAGVLEKNIEIATQCTYCDRDNYFSYRRDKETGRHASIVALKS